MDGRLLRDSYVSEIGVSGAREEAEGSTGSEARPWSQGKWFRQCMATGVVGPDRCGSPQRPQRGERSESTQAGERPEGPRTQWRNRLEYPLLGSWWLEACVRNPRGVARRRSQGLALANRPPAGLAAVGCAKQME